MRLSPVPSLPEIRIYAASPASGLWRLADSDGGDLLPPYWAYPWAGGLALARHLLDRPETARGRSVLDLGSGSGIVGIAAMKVGAKEVIAADIDPNAVAATGLNAAANGVALAVIGDDLMSGSPPAVDLIVAGDLFYEPGLAERATTFLGRCVTAGIEVLVGDPGRTWLPRSRLHLIARYAVPDFGSVGNASAQPSGVFSFGPAAALGPR